MRLYRLFIRFFIFLLSALYPNWEQMNVFIIDLRCASFIYCSTLVREFSFYEAFIHKETTWSSKRKLLLKRTISSFWFQLLLIVLFLTRILILSVVFTSWWHVPGLTLKYLFESQSKSLPAFSSSNFTIFCSFESRA